MWWWGILNKYQAVGFLVTATGSWATHLAVVPRDLALILAVLSGGLLICALNKFQNMAPTARDVAQDRLREPTFVVFWPGLAVFAAGVVAGQVLRVAQDGVSPGVAFAHGATIVVAGVGIVGVKFVVNRMTRKKS